jgi:hypothetical protein
LVFRSLNKPKSLHVRFLICDPYDHPACVEAWDHLTLKKDAFRKDLETTYENLREWVEEANEKHLNLEVKRTPIVPLSITFVDTSESEEEGIAVFVPQVFERRSEIRPCFLISKKQQPNIFSEYLAAYEWAFNQGIPIA